MQRRARCAAAGCDRHAHADSGRWPARAGASPG